MTSQEQRVLERVLGVQWDYALFDYDTVLGVAGATNTGRRATYRIEIHGGVGRRQSIHQLITTTHKDAVCQAQAAIIKQFVSPSKEKP